MPAPEMYFLTKKVLLELEMQWPVTLNLDAATMGLR
jgi:hypothetical protein